MERLDKKSNNLYLIKWLIIFITLLKIVSGCGRVSRLKRRSEFKEDNLFSVAENFYEKGQYEEAELLYKSYLKFDPNSSLTDNALFRLGLIAIKKKDYALAIKQFKEILNGYPESELLPSVRFNIAYSHFLNTAWDLALEALISYQADFPLSQYSPDVKLLLADIYLKTREYKKAKEEALATIKLFHESEFKDKALYQLGLAEMYLNELDSATLHFEQALSGNLPDDYKENILYSLGTINLMKEDLYHAVKYFSDLVRRGGTEERKQRIYQKIEGLMKEHLSTELLLRFIEENPDKFPGDLALIEIGERRFREGNVSDTNYYWNLFLSNFPNHSQTLYIQNRLSFINETGEDTSRAKFGCIAPLTGPLSEYGERMARGIKMAIEEYNQTYGTSVKLVLFDSQAKPDMAQKGVQLLAYQEKVSAIIGPLLTSTAIAAAEVAEGIGIPLFTPTATGDGLPETGRFIFRNCLANRHQTEALADFAVNTMGLKRFGIVFPYNAYGQEMMSLFADQVENIGGEVEIIEFYDPEDTDFKEQLQRVHKIRPEALFLPDSYEKIVLIAPQIPFYEPEEDPNDPNQIAIQGIDPNNPDQKGQVNQNLLALDSNDQDQLDEIEMIILKLQDEAEEALKKRKRPIQLFGTDGWYDKRVIKEAESYVKGAIISVGFNPESSDTTVREFVKNFRARYAEQPDLVSAQAYDATNMLLEASDAAKADWDTIRKRLSLIKDFHGVSGRTTILPSGDSDKDVSLLKIIGRKFVPVEGSHFNQMNELPW